ncbi:hypothetical protein Mucpa_0879 [Mucilaginibacter paludis DSM 18603]|uniref:Uncharacterized protein n=1 Tax=Mucilaginibacter paludis DSM 18603 TaxID=714943 RepID=H1YBI9_9SPHI|nr:hypothetical protein Mucpa_0879 [Mucilaginibacter paludis DSM 18603]
MLISLFIYLFYRTDRTFVNEIAIRLISFQKYKMLKARVGRLLPLNSLAIYSLPEGLWVFCITLTSKTFYVKLNKWRLNCVFIPLIFCVSLEILQLWHITNGRFDFMDIAVSLVFWIIASNILTEKDEKQNIFARPNSNSIICLASYCIVYLAHVFK